MFSGSSNPSDADLIASAAMQVQAARERLRIAGGQPPPALADVDESREDDIAAELAADSIPGYQIVAERFRGGQGAVFEALQRTTRRRVAIKVLHGTPHRLATSRARFEREAQVLAQLRHPNIVAVHECSEAGGRSYFVMDYVDGAPLDRWVAAKTAGDDWSTEDCLRLFAKICDAVQAAHVRGVIHRDLKPGNVLVDELGEPRVVDFGLAKHTDDSSATAMTATGQFVGSLPWSSPEQVQGNSDVVDTRSDVYSLGVMLHHALTGAFPYPAGVPIAEFIQNIRNLVPEPPSRLKRAIDPDIDTIVLKCLQKDPDRRYQTAGELGRDLERALAGLPLEARRDSPGYVLRKYVARYRWVIGVTASIVLLVTAGAVTALLLWRQASHERDMATEAKNLADQRFDQLRALAHTFIFDLDDRICDLPGTTPARLFITQTARSYLDALAADPRSDRALRRETALAYRKVGEVLGRVGHANLGRYDEAAEVLTQGRDMLEHLIKEDTTDLDARRDLGSLEMALGDVERMRGKIGPAAAHYQRSYDLARETADTTGVPRDVRDAAMALLVLSDVAVVTGRADEALQHALAGVALLEGLPRDGSDSLGLRRDRSVAYTRVGDRHSDAGAHADARAWYEKSLAIDEARLRDAPESMTAQRDVTVDLLRVSESLMSEERGPDALEMTTRAVAMRDTAMREDPQNAQAIRDLATACYTQAQLLEALADLSERDLKECRSDLEQAHTALQRSLDLWETMRASGVMRASDAGAGDELRAKIAEVDAKIELLGQP